MIEQFNRILRAFGANRVRIEDVNGGYIIFELVGLSAFRLNQDGKILERIEQARYGGWEITDRSRWLQAISEGKVRNDAGEMVTK